MSDEVSDALDELLAVVLTINPSPQDSLVAGWVYPDSYSSISVANFPMTVVSRVVGVVDSWEIKAVHGGIHYWNAEALIFLAEGRLDYPSARSAAAELKQTVYERAMATALYQNMSLNGTVLGLGGPSSGDGFKLFDCMINHFQWNTGSGHKTYWGLRFVIPIRQSYNQIMSQ